MNEQLNTDITTTETLQQRLIRTGQAKPRFLQGVFPFAGRGFFENGPLDDTLRYLVPADKTAEIVYMRAGNLSDDLIYLTLCVDTKAIRYFPVSARGDLHVPLAIVEDYPAGSVIDIGLAAARGLTGSVVVDLGILECDSAK